MGTVTGIQEDLVSQRYYLIRELSGLVDRADRGMRPFSQEEMREYLRIQSEVLDIDTTIWHIGRGDRFRFRMLTMEEEAELRAR